MGNSAVVSNFTNSHLTYDGNATIQAIAASHLSDALSEITSNLPDGDVLELGCGTGLFSLSLIRALSDRRIVLTDASRELLEICRRKTEREVACDTTYGTTSMSTRLTSTKSLSFECLEVAQLIGNFAEAFDLSKTSQHSPAQPPPVARLLSNERRIALIASSFMFQWVDNLDACLNQLSALLQPGGCLLFSVPSSQSFSEWKQVCELHNLAFTGNRLPEEGHFRRAAQRLDLECKLSSATTTVHYDDARLFFKNLKLTGSHTRLSEGDNAPLWQTIQLWNQSHPKPIGVTYQILYGYLRSRHH